MGRLDDKVVLISGGARGQGAVEARMFASEGACVVFGDILDDEGRKVEAEIRELGGQATYVHLDVTSESDWAGAVNAAVSEYGKLNVLVNNAGIVLGRSIEEMTVEEWDRLFDVNAKGVFLGTKTALPALREAGGGSIVNISSTAGLVGNDYNLAGYSSTKGRGQAVHQVHGHPARQRGDTLQFGASGTHRHADAAGIAAQPGQRAQRRGAAAAGPAGTNRTAGRHRLRGDVPGVGRGVVRDGQRGGG